jgi:hypothetical protein
MRRSFEKKPTGSWKNSAHTIEMRRSVEKSRQERGKIRHTRLKFVDPLKKCDSFVEKNMDPLKMTDNSLKYQIDP